MTMIQANSFRIILLLMLSVFILPVMAEDVPMYTMTDDDVVVENGVITSATIPSGATRITFPDSLDGQVVTEINAYLVRKSLTEVVLPSHLLSIGEVVFYDNNIATVTIPSEVVSIGVSAFSDNDVENIIFEDNSALVTINQGAFANHRMTSLSLPNGVTFIGASAFSVSATAPSASVFAFDLPRNSSTISWENGDGETIALGSRIEEFSTSYSGIVEDYTLTDDDVVVEGGVIVSCSYNYQSRCITIPSLLDGQTVVGISSRVFKKKNIIELSLPNTLESIGLEAFYGNNIANLIIPASVTTIGTSAFSLCGIKTVDFVSGSKLKYIGDSAFATNYFTDLELPSSLGHLGIRAFNKNNITVLNGKPFDGLFFGRNDDGSLDSTVVVSCGNNNLESVVIPEGVKVIEKSVFSMMRELTHVQLPVSIEVIEERCFVACSELRSVSSSSDSHLTSIGSSAFTSCGTLSVIDFTCFKGLVSVGSRAFNRCESLASIDLDLCVDLAYIGMGAFSSCGFSSFTLPVVGSGYLWLDPLGGAYGSSDEITNLSWAYTGGSDHEVAFLDWDSTMIASVTVAHGANATEPQLPARLGYDFAGWSDNITKVMMDVTVMAEYTLKSYIVTFVDALDDVLLRDTVIYQDSATAPEPPVRDGYAFVKWDKDFSNVSSNLTVKTEYELNSYIVSFVDWDNTVIVKDTVEHGSAATPPAHPTRDGYTFVAWHADFTSITETMTVFSQYAKNSAIDDEASAPNLSLYPNPAYDCVTVDAPINSQCKVLDCRGRECLSVKIVKSNQRLDVTSFESGVYFVLVGDEVSKLFIE